MPLLKWQNEPNWEVNEAYNFFEDLFLSLLLWGPFGGVRGGRGTRRGGREEGKEECQYLDSTHFIAGTEVASNHDMFNKDKGIQNSSDIVTGLFCFVLFCFKVD